MVTGHAAFEAALEPPGRAALLGRADELALLIDLVAESGTRMVTIVGLAGVGKTRLAREVATQVLISRGTPTVFVPLGGIREAAMIADEIFAGLPGGPGLGTSAADALWESYGGGEVLLVLDSVEQIVGAAAAIGGLLEGYPALQVLTTSTRSIEVPGEVVVRLRPLPVPPDGLSPAQASENPCVALFVQRARSIDAGFSLTAQNVAGVVATCRAVAGFPLAIELAAARSGSIPPAVMAGQLALPSGMALLRDEAGVPGDRHASIESTLQWSFDLLTPSARHALLQLAVFEGSFDLEAALAVLDPPAHSTAEMLDRLSPLIDVALLDLSAADPQLPRLRVPELVRGFARTRLAQSESADEVRARHTAHFQARCVSSRPVVAEELGDLLTALDRAILDGSADQALHATVAAATALSSFPGAAATVHVRLDDLVDLTGRFPTDDVTLTRALIWSADHGEGVVLELPYSVWLGERVSEAVAAARRSGDRAALLEALMLQVRALPTTLDLAGGLAAAQEGLVLARTCGDDRALARFELYAAMSANSRGNHVFAAEHAASALARARGCADASTAIQAALELHRLPTEIVEGLGPLPTLEELLAQCQVERLPQVGLYVLGALAARDLTEGATTAAAAWIRRGLLISNDWLRTRPLVPVALVAMLVTVAIQHGDLDVAVRLRSGLSRYDVVFERMPQVATGYPAACVRLAAEVSPQQFAEWAADAASMTTPQLLQAALAYLQRVPTPTTVLSDPTAPGLASVAPVGEPLTPREREVLVHLATGESNKEIARALNMRPKTVMHHSMAIYRKLGVRGRGEAAAWAYRNGYSQPT